MWLTSKLKQVLMVLKPGVVTLPYPFEPRPVSDTFRGQPHWDHNKCVGCGGCAAHCSARTIFIRDVCQEVRVLLYDSSRCTYCGRCADVCPEDAIVMSNEFEMATDNKEDLTEKMELFMLTCQRCGRCYDMETPNKLDSLGPHGFRYDNLEYRIVTNKFSDTHDTALLKDTEVYKRPTKVEE